jgi:hypothetical protein
MQTRKVNQDGRSKWLSPWHLVVFTMGAVVGAILCPFYGPAYTSAGIVVTCWLAALLLVAFDRRIPLPRAAPMRRRGRRPAPAAGGGAMSAAAQGRRSDARGGASSFEARRARLRPILGGKGDPPSRAS